MQDSSTKPAQTGGQPVLNEEFAVQGPPSHGFTILYNNVAAILRREHSAVWRCYVSLCIRSNSDRKMYAAMKTLAADMDMDETTAGRAVKRLEELGLVEVTRPQTQGRGRANVYKLLVPGNPAPMGDISQGNPAPVQDIPGENPASVQKKSRTHAGPTNTSVNKEKRDTEPAPKSDQGKGAEIRGGGPGPAGVSGVSNPVDTYFQDPLNGPVRSWQFDQVFAKYPKQENERAARAAWMHKIGNQMDQARQGADPELPAVKLWLAVFYAVDWWAAKVTGKLGEDAWKPQFIITMDKWISQEKWMDAPKCVREGNC